MERVLPPNNNKNPRNNPAKKEHSLFDDEFPIAHTASLDDEDDSTHQRPITAKPVKKGMSRWLKVLLGIILVAFLTLVGFIAFAAYTYWTSVYPTLPNVAELKNIQMQVPLRVYTSDEKLIAEYGEKSVSRLAMNNFHLKWYKLFSLQKMTAFLNTRV